jgi:hypothetical protein
MIEEDPGFIENEQSRPTGEAGFEPVEEIGQTGAITPACPISASVSKHCKSERARSSRAASSRAPKGPSSV